MNNVNFVTSPAVIKAMFLSSPKTLTITQFLTAERWFFGIGPCKCIPFKNEEENVGKKLGGVGFGILK